MGREMHKIRNNKCISSGKIGLVVRYRNLLDESWSVCSRLQLYGNETHSAPRDLFISCPFSNELYESIPYELDYLVNGETYNYTKRYVFNVPRHESIGERLR